MAGPVLPLVNRMAASSLFSRWTAKKGAAPSRSSWWAGRPQPRPGQLPTVTRRRTLPKALGNRRESSTATGSPIKAVGCIEATQRKKPARPMPGSMSTGTAPTLNTAKTKGMKRRLGLMSRLTRSPGPTPWATRPRA